MMKLPHADRAVVDVVKLRDYSLSAKHEEGKHKARVFADALGLKSDDADLVASEIIGRCEGRRLSDGKKERVWTALCDRFRAGS